MLYCGRVWGVCVTECVCVCVCVCGWDRLEVCGKLFLAGVVSAHHSVEELYNAILCAGCVCVCDQTE